MPTDARGDWNVLHPQAAAPLFLALDASWWVTGGWALDLFLARERPHRDLDFAVLRREHGAVRSHLAAWDMHVVHDRSLTAWSSGEPLPVDRTTVWARPAKYLPWQLEIFFESAEADDWVYCRDERVRPEVVLLHRAAQAPAATDDGDVREVAGRLSAAGRHWLIDALTTAHPGHRWIGQI